MTLREVVLRQLDYTFEQEDWYPPLTVAIRGLTAKQAAWKPAPGRHSIWQIVRHVTHWKRPLLDRWAGLQPDYTKIEATDWEEMDGDEAAWQADVKALHEVSRKLRAAIEQMDDEELLRPPAGGDKPKLFSALDAATHDAYHAAQIRYIRALQGV